MTSHTQLGDGAIPPWGRPLPAAWGSKRLKRAVRLINERTEETDLQYVGLENIEPWTNKFLQTDTPAGEGSSSLFRPDDVLFGKLRPYLAKVARCSTSGRCSSELLVLRPHSISPRYLTYLLVSDPVIALVNASTFGAKMPRASWGFIGNVMVPIPPTREQDRIADVLDVRTAAIDSAVAAKRQHLSQLVELRIAAIYRAVTKGLRGSASKNSGSEWMGEIPANWEVRRIKHVARLESGHTPDRSEPAYWTDTNDIPWVSLNDTEWLAENDYISDTAFRVNELGLANSSARLLPSRAVVFTRDATIGKAAITTRPMAVSQHIIAWVCGPSMHPEYLLYVLYAMEKELERYTMGATIRTIGMQDVKQLMTPVPPIEEQVEVAAHLSRESGRLSEAIATTRTQIDVLVEYRKALIAGAVSGQMDVEAYSGEAA